MTYTERANPATLPAAGAGPAGQAGDREPLLGGLGRTLALLFPATPPGRPRSYRRTVRMVIANVAALCAGAGVLLIRQAGTPSWQTLWAEDRWVFLPRAVLHPWPGLVTPQAGYMQLIPQLVADVVARFPLRSAAAGFAVAGALIASGCAVFAYHASNGHIRKPALRVLAGASVLLLPTAVIEVANSGVDAPWYLMFAVYWALLWRPRSRRGMAVAAVLAFVAMASNILDLLYLPLVAARVLALPRAREHAATFGWLAGAAFQVIGVLQSREPHRIGSVPGAFHFYGQHVLVSAVVGWRLALRLQAVIGVSACIAVAACMVAALAAWVAWRGNSRVRAFAATALAMGMILCIIPALIRYWVPSAVSTQLWVPGSRYTVSAILLIDAIAIVAVDARLRRTGHANPSTATSTRAGNLRHSAAAGRLEPVRPLLAVLLIAGLGVGWCTSFRYANLRSSSIPWSRTYTRFNPTVTWAAEPADAQPAPAPPGHRIPTHSVIPLASSVRGARRAAPQGQETRPNG